MKLVKTASGKKTIKISKSEWQSIGKKAGWMKTAQASEISQEIIGLNYFIDEVKEKYNDFLQGPFGKAGYPVRSVLEDLPNLMQQRDRISQLKLINPRSPLVTESDIYFPFGQAVLNGHYISEDGLRHVKESIGHIIELAKNEISKLKNKKTSQQSSPSQPSQPSQQSSPQNDMSETEQYMDEQNNRGGFKKKLDHMWNKVF